MKQYNLVNNALGWLSFFVAATIYLLTKEPTASFWDCSEFIISSYKLEVGHPPGAPFFMLTAKFFTLFTSDPTQVASMVNSMSAIMSALTILFLFWTVTHLAKKLIYSDVSKAMTMGQLIIIMGCGLLGALTYTFSDTFWFSAVEAEVYAYSSMFTALVVWLILKWENRANQEGADKWLVLIAYATGLSIGVHLLNLLCIPAIVLVYYFKKNEHANLKGTLIALSISFGLIVMLLYGVIPGFTKVGGWFEILFVNHFGLSYNSGALFYIVLLVANIIWCLFETTSAKGSLNRAKMAFVLCIALSGVVFIGSSVLLWIAIAAGLLVFTYKYKTLNFRLLNTSMLCLLVILIGYSSFALIPIRSIANTPMDQNSPEHVFSLASYLNRDQYGNPPLFYGRTYASQEARVEGRLKDPISKKEVLDKVVKTSESEPNKYVVSNVSESYEMTNEMLFPRMHSREGKHVTGYKIWGDVENEREAPTFMQNIRFFFTYQLDFMYFRYFMWNFAGRQNDIQGHGNISYGNWITGIGFVDELLGKGPQDNLPPDTADNKGHNAYYAIPFLLGILGIFFQIMQGRKGEQQFLVTFTLFFMTGIAVIIYLNQQPFEPRERDYAYAGSFYAFSIWIGLGAAYLWTQLKKVLPETPAAIAITVVCILVPLQMAGQNWDDHDRSDRYTMRDFAKNYLDTCEPNAILFTMGDNDTFPLWYMQEVEGFRTDVRVCNLSYLQTDWYVDQMRRETYDSKPLPIMWERARYMGDKGAAAHVLTRQYLENAILRELSDKNPEVKNWINHIDYNKFFDTKTFSNEMDLGKMLNILKTEDNYAPRNPFIEKGVVVPTSKLTMTVDTTNVDWQKFNTKPNDQFTIDLSGQSAVYRQDIMVMEMLYNISKDDWKRPIYYASTIGTPPLNLDTHSLLVGINYQISPGTPDSTGVNVDLTFNNMMHKYQWGGMDNPKIYLDENNLRMARTSRMMFSYLINALLKKGDNERALQALDRCIEAIPGNTVPRGFESLSFANSYFKLGQSEKGNAVLNEIMDRANGSLQWYARLNQMSMVYSGNDIREFLDLKISGLNMYRNYEPEKYNAMYDELLQQLNVFLANGVKFDPNAHPLDTMLHLSILDYQQEEDSVAKENLLSKANTMISLVNRYAPELLDQLQ